ncbi:type I inositol polyphosphate 5-phosphatase 4 isoform X1 [Cryptomeria japonica]|uniref:type I inositol polyphosphate 5-phosphatase 4 isoform X1 n=1 Tax=Cryptomeria japonica TaxID=3369 RepID=UPI0025ACCF1F|nr:type I inositol polyphosphate 5-phosphatase 4 isoform X1 [Cryptomeria japonica]XP_057830581.1 type I inositol polyphosphate 5-phosphatase 4 isoform X1 [Cryptomeria japonica]XP_057830582.1 type I inositol polyphosphate 5-phosphatase 4 isoform X1 [Cryptomeria japonica]XP_057830583.1 type I inositol polyphosphate 5-phosphatase 4 isoform X1 [Cryptomeria japonica]XP_057830584.1 type I inositol polyphosphate 5-phosphatase 4 isoform X1 [Cryptomeria japonica]
MKAANEKKNKFSWPKTLVRKWFNIKSKANEFHADEIAEGYSTRGGVEAFVDRRRSCSDKDSYSFRKDRPEKWMKKTPEKIKRGRMETDVSQVIDVQDFRVFVSTWNVGGKAPPNGLNLEEWLNTSPPADIYVLGFQEIVPLNAGNVLGAEDNGPVDKWLGLIRKTLNNQQGAGKSTSSRNPLSPASVKSTDMPHPIISLDSDFEGSASRNTTQFFHRRSFQASSRSSRMYDDSFCRQPKLERHFSVSDRVLTGRAIERTDSDNSIKYASSDDENGICVSDSPATMAYSPNSRSPSAEARAGFGETNYCLVASKQMVGIFLSIWARTDLGQYIHDVKVSCVGRGLMGYLGNKGSISISMTLHQTSFCFICTHLTSGQKDGDELRRNSDVMEIMKKTRFPGLHKFGGENSPETIMDHDRVIWLGDLNYRIGLCYAYTKQLVERNAWEALLENDQLRTEHKAGRVFKGWSEGHIHFAPTYKYSSNSDRYAGDGFKSKEKRRTPAWCDRILWFGRGLKQLSYVRGESKFSDHRPVYAVFLAEVETLNRCKSKKSLASVSTRIEVEELLPQTSCI